MQKCKNNTVIKASLIEQKPCYPCSGFSWQSTGFAVGKAWLPAAEAEALPFPCVAMGHCRLRHQEMGAWVSALKITMEN